MRCHPAQTFACLVLIVVVSAACGDPKQAAVSDIGRISARSSVLSVLSTSRDDEQFVALTICDGDMVRSEDDADCSEGRHVELWSGPPSKLRMVADSRRRPNRPDVEIAVSGPFLVDDDVLLEIGDHVHGGSQVVRLANGSFIDVAPPTTKDENSSALVCATSTTVWRDSYVIDLEQFVERQPSISFLQDGEWVPVDLAIPDDTIMIDLRCDRDDADLIVTRPDGQEAIDLVEAGT